MVKIFPVKISDENMKYIEELAKRLDRSRSWVIRRLLEKAIEQHKMSMLRLEGESG